ISPPSCFFFASGRCMFCPRFGDDRGSATALSRPSAHGRNWRSQRRRPLAYSNFTKRRKIMTMSARIYAGDAIGFGGWPAINDLLSAGYNTVILWSVHVDTDGTLYLNDTKLASGGNYNGAFPFNLPARVARLRQAGVEIIFSVGAGGTKDFTNIGNLLNGSPGDPDN